MSKSLSINSICSYFTPNAFSELLLSSLLIPIAVCNVSYGAPEILNIVSPGRKIPNNVTAKACVPDISCALTNASSALNIFA